MNSSADGGSSFSFGILSVARAVGLAEWACVTHAETGTERDGGKSDFLVCGANRVG